MPLVWADRIWLEQIIVNLISNAIDATANNLVHRTIRLMTRFDQERVHLIVHDNGSGIKEQDLEHIFEAFFTTKATGQGLGLGLSISYRLAKDMQGELSVINHPEGGAAFTLSLSPAKEHHDATITD
jgi:two-component system C4-dicarboxylate transport sensor histidine kinase DctB